MNPLSGSHRPLDILIIIITHRQPQLDPNPLTLLTSRVQNLILKIQMRPRTVDNAESSHLEVGKVKVAEFVEKLTQLVILLSSDLDN